KMCMTFHGHTGEGETDQNFLLLFSKSGSTGAPPAQNNAVIFRAHHPVRKRIMEPPDPRVSASS
ncbi:MAG: hypothetical protein ACLFQU_11835, partial [Candidatus Kapaibacterium sp.]